MPNRPRLALNLRSKAISLNDAQNDSLRAAAAREQAEELFAKMQQAFDQAQADALQRTDLTDQQRAEGELAMRKALDSTQRMIDSLNQALKIADQAAAQGGWKAEEQP
ncbi:hypothetical protein [Aeoliella mucimassa]|uniref:Uncharacterized protein n=1 Tax=Aeoliella mucimassa TaxID=2527972 RepID=A0A518AP21_9BACT|nr:hypothetical protein [Aeoliella mucimassa]QDU56479.1 hypothetical protein Pan181_26880 [Aeoliella mucimassa]